MFGMVVIAWSVEIGGHDAAVVGAVLAVVAFAHFDAGDFSYGIGLVGGFEGTGEECFLAHGLFGHFGVDAAGAQKHQLAHTGLKSSVDDVGFNHQVLVDEVGGEVIVSDDPPYSCGGQVNLIGTDGLEKGSDGLLIGKVKFSF